MNVLELKGELLDLIASVNNIKHLIRLKQVFTETIH
jgi:hypothetical protein